MLSLFLLSASRIPLSIKMFVCWPFVRALIRVLHWFCDACVRPQQAVSHDPRSPGEPKEAGEKERVDAAGVYCAARTRLQCVRLQNVHTYLRAG